MAKDIYKEISDAKQKRAAMLADLKKKLAAAESDKAKADAATAEAIKNENADAYTKAKADGRTAEDQIEFYKLQINKYDNQPLFNDKETRKEKADAIRARADEVKAEKMKDAAQHLKAAYALINETRAEILKANGALADIAENTGKKTNEISALAISSLGNNMRTALEHLEIKPFV